MGLDMVLIRITFKLKNKLIYLSLLVFLSIACFAQETDKYGGFVDIKGEKTGFFHTEQIDGRWWLVTPEGHGFHGVGMAHPVTDFSKSAVLFNYNGDQEAFFKGAIEHMRFLGYNCVWSGPYCPERLQSGYINKELSEKVFREAEFPYVFPIPLIKHDVEYAPDQKRPDVFSKEYAEYVENITAKYAPGLKDDPWVMGYYWGFGSFDQESVWLNHTLERKGSAGRGRFMNILEERYEGDIEKFNKVYGSNFESFRALAKNGDLAYPKWIKRVKFGHIEMPDTYGAEDMYEDFQALLGEMVTEVYRLGHDAMKKHDPNHLLFGSYVKEATLTMDMWRRVNPYIDIISPQHISKVFPVTPIVKELNKPALLSDQPLGNVYSPALLVSKGAYGPVPDYIDRLVMMDILAEKISHDPNYIGAQFCACLVDQSHPDKAYELGQPGYFTIEGEAKPLLCRTTKKINKKIKQNVLTPPYIELANTLLKEYYETYKAHNKVVNDRKEFLKKYPPYGSACENGCCNNH